MKRKQIVVLALIVLALVAYFRLGLGEYLSLAALKAQQAAQAAAAWVDTAATGSWGTEEESEREFQNNLFIEMFSLTQEEK